MGTGTRMLRLALGLSGPPLLLAPLWLLLTGVQPGTGVEHIRYVPRLSGATLAGKLTQSTFTLEQPQGQFNHTSISDFDSIWLVVAYSNATQNFVASQKPKDIPVPATFTQKGYYFTMPATRLHYPSGPAGSQLRVLRVGNDTHCSPTKEGCNAPLPDSGPYRVKFLVMNDRGPVAETEWSNETRLQQAKAFEAVLGSQSEGTVVIITFLSILLAILLAVVLVLLYTWFQSLQV
ncbi:PREDICTED: uroplakin-3b-like protein isoform X2 [Chinchilla lanigera]|uniref:uroplakin-3b-like protein isoform X2 n=1 Tax=Chinchilla lanigera TaxID=34839 RepID=UPI000696EC23|nr:PREDICTED: uroplakin-3b-like protein isoform X2 [Chinchilla lanigera]